MKKHKGFSLIEMVIVMAIIAILIAVTIPSFNRIIQRSAKSKVDQVAMAMNSSIVHNVQDYNGLTSTNITTTLDARLTPLLIRENDLLERDTTQIRYLGYFFDDISPVQSEFDRIRNDESLTTASNAYNITIFMPDNEVHTDNSITFNLNRSIYIIVKTEGNTYIYRNGVDVTDEFTPATT